MKEGVDKGSGGGWYFHLHYHVETVSIEIAQRIDFEFSLKILTKRFELKGQQLIKKYFYRFVTKLNVIICFKKNILQPL